LSYQQDSKKHLTSRDYYSWGIIVLKIKEAATAVYDLFAMVKPGGWKILLETEYGLYYNLYYKIDSVLRDYVIQQSGVTETDYEDYDYYTDVLHALQYGEKKLYVDITFVGQMFDLYGNYFDSFANNSITLEEIEQYNLYYESNDNKFTLLRYSTHYSSYSDGEKKLYADITFVGQMFDLYGNYFDSFANNSITLEEIEQYNLYYESNDNKFTLLRYSTHYSSYSVL
jgi:hypothetical protein